MLLRRAFFQRGQRHRFYLRYLRHLVVQDGSRGEPESTFSLAGVQMRVGGALFAGCIAALVLVVAAPARVDDASTLKAEFLRDYPRALEKLEARFLRVRGVAKYKDERHLIDTRGMDIGVTAITNSTLEFECKLPSLV